MYMSLFVPCWNSSHCTFDSYFPPRAVARTNLIYDLASPLIRTCHVERSETSLFVAAFRNDLRFFASLRMTFMGPLVYANLARFS